MAKKKKRSANVARKREKRNRNQKSKHKQLALEKQRRLQFSKLDEEDIFDLLMNSRRLVTEPEFENVHFDFGETISQLSNYIQLPDMNAELNYDDEDNTIPDDEEEKRIPDDGEDDGILVDEDNTIPDDDEDNSIPENGDERNRHLKDPFFPSMEDVEYFIESFLDEAMPTLMTPELIGSLKVALSSCEKRFKRTGDRSQAEVAFVARTFFEVAPKDQYIEHPIFEGILMNTIRIISTQQLPTNSGIKEEPGIVSDTISPNLQDLDDAMLRKPLQPYYDPDNDTSIPDYQQFLDGTISDKYPVNALYRNCIGRDIIELLNDWDTKHPETYNIINGDASGQEIETYIHITSDRLHLYAHSPEDLTIAMDALEAYCQSAVMFLAKTIDEGGDSDGTE